MIGQLLRAAGSRRRTIDALVRQVAEASADVVVDIVADKLAGMGPCEARGYIRARAGREVRRRAWLAVRREAELSGAWEAIAVRASDRVPPLVMRRLSAAARAAEPRRVA
jgi:hypothetical protein